MPIIPILATLAGLTGIGTLIWYYSKAEDERARLDSKAEQIAQAWFNKSVKNLSIGQAKDVYDEVKRLS